MSASDPNSAIYVTDSAKEIKNKVSFIITICAYGSVKVSFILAILDDIYPSSYIPLETEWLLYVFLSEILLILVGSNLASNRG